MKSIKEKQRELINNQSLPEDKNGVLVNEIWKPYRKYLISNYGRHISPYGTRISDDKSIQFVRSDRESLINLVGLLFCDYDPSNHFITRCNPSATYPNAADNLKLIQKHQSGEEWRTINGYPGYEVSSYGRVCSHHQHYPNLLTPDTSSPYLRYTLKRDDGGYTRWLAHRLVVKVFCDPPNFDSLVVNHIDACKTNNRLDNLEAVTHQENIMHAVALGLNTLPGRNGGRRELDVSTVKWNRRTVDVTGFVL